MSFHAAGLEARVAVARDLVRDTIYAVWQNWQKLDSMPRDTLVDVGVWHNQRWLTGEAQLTGSPVVMSVWWTRGNDGVPMPTHWRPRNTAPFLDNK